MAAVVAATALKGRGARNARVLRGKEREPGEGRTVGDLFSLTPLPTIAGSQSCQYLLKPLCRFVRVWGRKDAL
jgi:hypothetical protein